MPTQEEGKGLTPADLWRQRQQTLLRARPREQQISNALPPKVRVRACVCVRVRVCPFRKEANVNPRRAYFSKEPRRVRISKRCQIGSREKRDAWVRCQPRRSRRMLSCPDGCVNIKLWWAGKVKFRENAAKTHRPHAPKTETLRRRLIIEISQKGFRRRLSFCLAEPLRNITNVGLL